MVERRARDPNCRVCRRWWWDAVSATMRSNWRSGAPGSRRLTSRPLRLQEQARRYPETQVDYRVADLFHAPPDWTDRFDFVFECYTLQALPADVRTEAIEKLAEFVAPGGHLLLIARGRDAADPKGDMPWPLTKEEVGQFERFGLTTVSQEDYPDGSTRRFRVLYQRL